MMADNKEFPTRKCARCKKEAEVLSAGLIAINRMDGNSVLYNKMLELCAECADGLEDVLYKYLVTERS